MKNEIGWYIEVILGIPLHGFYGDGTLPSFIEQTIVIEWPYLDP